jgi:murein DD-endopeptidase MepM/ murein hydrolase activator NlpD
MNLFSLADGEDADLSSLLQEVVGLFNNKQSFVPVQQELPATDTTIQAPIKGGFFNSGSFAPGSPSPRHPGGHAGVDLRAPGGTAVYPMISGVVTLVGSNPKGGNTVSIQHPNNLRTYYAHLGTIRVQKGDKVNLNTVIGTVGASGNAKGTWPHVHLQVWSNNQLQDPAKYFAVPKYTPANASEQQWLTPNAKREADAFNIKRHLASRRASFHRQVEELHKLAERYYLLTNPDRVLKL